MGKWVVFLTILSVPGQLSKGALLFFSFEIRNYIVQEALRIHCREDAVESENHLITKHDRLCVH